jgi:hypothetical protein
LILIKKNRFVGADDELADPTDANLSFEILKNV